MVAALILRLTVVMHLALIIHLAVIMLLAVVVHLVVAQLAVVVNLAVAIVLAWSRGCLNSHRYSKKKLLTSRVASARVNISRCSTVRTAHTNGCSRAAAAASCSSGCRPRCMQCCQTIKTEQKRQLFQKL